MTSRKSIVFNVAAIVVAVSAVGAVVKSWVYAPGAAPCETRYRNVLVFKLDRDGRPLALADLQGRFGGRDAGLDRNLEIGPLAGAPKPLAMKVSMPKGSGVPDAANVPPGGMTFPWEPANIRSQPAACLAYNVLLSTDFDSSHDGVLPGLRGGADGGLEHFAVGPAWLKSGEAGIAFDIVLKPDANEPVQQQVRPSLNVENTAAVLPKGRWLRINQELVLNQADAPNGLLRIWVDGKLIAERTDMRLRTDNDVVLTGVSARAHMLADTPKATAEADSSVSLTAFELMW